MRLNISFCGLDCNNCPVYLATIETDEQKKRILREEIAITLREKYNMDIHADEVADCDGCPANNRLFSGCKSCAIRKCAIEKNIQSCAYCEEYPCKNLDWVFREDSQARTRLDEIKYK